MQTTNWSRNLDVEVRGDDVVSHTGSVITRMLADRTGLTSGLSDALARPDVIHDRGAVFRDMAVSIADGGTHICDLAVLGDQQRVFGSVASTSTAWRALNEIDTKGLTEISLARNKARQRVWELIVDRHGKIPPVKTCYGDLGEVIGIRIDATLVNSYSDKQLAAGNFKGGYGFHPLTSWCDNTGESLAIIARTGSAGSNTAADHIAIIDASIAALPVEHRRRLLITIDGAGSTHDVLDHLTALNARRGYTVEYSVGFDLDARVRGAITAMPEDVWSEVLDATGKARDDESGVAEITGLLRHGHDGDRLAGWPDDMRVFVRREPIEYGTQLTPFEQHNGYRYQPFATNTGTGQAQRIEARHRVHARVEGYIRCGKDTGLASWPSTSFDVNQAWVSAVAIAIDLLCWTRLLLLNGPLADADRRLPGQPGPVQPPTHPTENADHRLHQPTRTRTPNQLISTVSFDLTNSVVNRTRIVKTRPPWGAGCLGWEPVRTFSSLPTFNTLPGSEGYKWRETMNGSLVRGRKQMSGTNPNTPSHWPTQ